MKKYVLGLAIAALFAGQAYAAVVGQTVRSEWFFPDSTTVIFTADAIVVDPGVEWHPGAGVPDIDMAEGTLLVRNETRGWVGAAFNGFRFTDVNGTIPDFTSFTLVGVDGNKPPIDPALSFDADHLLVNFTPTGAENIAADFGSVYRFAFTVGSGPPVPEPVSTLVAVMAALGMLGLCSRRREA